MITQKKITEMFEVKRGTLGIWKTSKPKLYNYLINYDEQYEKFREINILLKEYIKKDSAKIFLHVEIQNILNIGILNTKSIDRISLHVEYISKLQNKKIPIEEHHLNIAEKLNSLNLVQQYIFCECIENVNRFAKEKDSDLSSLVRHYFLEFLSFE